MQVQMQTKCEAHCAPRDSMYPMIHELDMGGIPSSCVLHDCGENNHPQERKKEKVYRQMRSGLYPLIIIGPSFLIGIRRLP